jgi:hypothetical protein
MLSAAADPLAPAEAASADPTLPTTDDAMLIIAQEGRPEGMVGLRLLVASLARHDPGVPMHAYVPSEMVAEVDAWVRQIHPRGRAVAFDTDIGWGCKPAALLQALDGLPRPDQRAVWIDADILSVASLRKLGQLPTDVFLMAEETTHHDNPMVRDRQAALGLTPGDPRVTTLSSCVVGVTAQHRRILEAYDRGVRTDLFASMQTRPWRERLLPGDQEVLEAVVCSGEFRNTPLHVLRNHNEMVQATYVRRRPIDGHRPGQAPPLLVHATGDLKPWRTAGTRLTKEAFPYFDHARGYLDQLDPAQRDAFASSSRPARLLKNLFGTRGAFAAYVKLRQWHARLTG